MNDPVATPRGSAFSADRPISGRSEDRLDRTAYAEQLALAICSWKGTDSLVLGLYGPWGCGKTSLKNMVRDALTEQPANIRPDVVDFNPWSFAGQDQLAETFFAEVGKRIGAKTDGTNDSRVAKKWRLYASALRVGKVVADQLPRLVGSALAATFFFGGLGIVSSFVQVGWIRVVGGILSIMAFLIAGIAAALAAVSERVSEWFLARSEARTKTVPEIKSELSELLRKRSRPLLVVMDDVDRLVPSEIRLLFQLVKANCDLPRIVYLMLFQRDVVEKYLAESGAGSGPDYLEKIVQVGFDVPVANQRLLNSLLSEGLNHLIADVPEERFDHRRWANVFIPGLQPFFETLRDVYRFLSTLEFHLGILKRGGSFEVCIIDLIALEVLRLHEPAVYRAAAGMKNILTQARDSEAERESTKVAVEGLVGCASERRRKAVEEIVKQLFPTVEWVLGGSNYGADWAEGWARELRVCSPEAFDRFFCLTVPQDEMGQYEIDRILTVKGDRKALVTEFHSLEERGLLGAAMERMEAWKEEVDLGVAVPFVEALFDIGDKLPEAAPGFFVIEPRMHAARIIYWYLRREEDAGRKERILEEAMRETAGILLPVMTVSLELDREKKDRSGPREWLIRKENITHFKSICLEKIKEAASNGSLLLNRHLLYLLFHWIEWEKDMVREWVARVVEKTEDALVLLQSFVQRTSSFSFGDYVARIRWIINLGTLEKFIEYEKIEKALQGIDEKILSAEAQHAVECFRKAVARRRAGKPDSGTTVGEDDSE